jgi:hypothetical protein
MALVTPKMGKGWCSFALTGQTSHAATEAGSVGVILNPEDAAVIVTRCVVYHATSSTAGANLIVHNAATVALAHDGSALFPAHAIDGAIGTANNGYACGDADDALVVVGATEYIGAFASADSTGYTGTCYLEYVHV